MKTNKTKKKPSASSKKSRDAARSLVEKPIAVSPIDMQGAKKRGLRTQFAALCYRLRKGKPEILLITSRRTRRWIIPKGWPQDGVKPAQSAAIEALEEAGVEGKTKDTSLGMYSYTKQHVSGRVYPCIALVYPLKVKTVHDTYRESKQRDRKWFSRADAARKVTDPELAHLIRTFDPSKMINAS